MANGWHRRNNNSPASQARKKEYNSTAYKAAKRAGQHQVDTGRAHCWRCGNPIPPGSLWHLGHDDHDRSIIRGPEHPHCNLTAAAKAGNRKSNHTSQPTRRSTRTW